MSDINLLPKTDSSSLKQERAVAFFRTLSIGILSLTAFISVVMFLLVVFSPLSKTQQEEKNLITQLSSYSTRIGRNAIVQERLSSIANILKTRNDYERYITVLVSALPQEVEIEKLSTSPETIIITGKSKSQASANEFFLNLTSLKEKKEYFKDISLNSFSLQPSIGMYTFVVEVTLL